MTVLLQEVFDKASTLPEALQNQIAEDLLADIEAEMQWDQTFKDTEDQLAKLADKALNDFKLGKVKQMGFDEL